MNKRVLLFFALSLLAGVFFWQVATGVNASKYDQEEYRRVQHPDFIPSRTSVAVAGAGYDSAIGDRYWLETVQYIGTHAAGGEYKAYLAALLGLVTDIDPRMESAYVLGQTLLPSEPTSGSGADPHLASAIALGKKWLLHLCDADKLSRISERKDLSSLLSPETRDPCATYWVALYLGYDYYFYADDPEKAVEYYKIAAAHADAPVGVRTIAATLLSDSGDPTAAASMLLGLASSMQHDAPACASIAATLDRLYTEDMADGFLDYSFIQPARGAQDFVDAYEREHTIAAGLCREYLLRFERMVQLAHAHQADAAYAAVHGGEHAPDADTLTREGYLPYETSDFQRLADGSRVVYVRDTETGRWVARMRSPDGRVADPRRAVRY